MSREVGPDPIESNAAKLGVSAKGDHPCRCIVDCLYDLVDEVLDVQFWALMMNMRRPVCRRIRSPLRIASDWNRIRGSSLELTRVIAQSPLPAAEKARIAGEAANAITQWKPDYYRYGAGRRTFKAVKKKLASIRNSLAEKPE